MQSSDIVLNNLSKQSSRKNYCFDRLYRNFFNSDFYYKAYSNLYANNGSAAKGIDNMATSGFFEEKIKQIMDMFSDESYQPKPVRCEYIPKKNSGKSSPGIPSFTDKIVEEICRAILEAIYEPIFENESHGFRPNKSCHTALNSIKLRFRGVNWFIKGDIEGLFDGIDHNVLINILKEKISDEKFLRLIRKFLKAGYIENCKHYKTYSGVRQGGIMSSVLSNIYLDKLDKYILKMAETSLLHTIPYHKSTEGEYKRFEYIRCADSWIIGICGSKQYCQDIKEKIEIFLRYNLHLELSNENTLITHSSNQVKFLGYVIRLKKEYTASKNKNSVSKRILNNVHFLIPKNVIEQFILNKRMVQDINSPNWTILHRPELLNQSDLEIVRTYNAEIEDIYNYYCLAENVSVKMCQLRYIMEYSCLKTLAGKHKTSIAKIKKRYYQEKHWGILYETETGLKIEYFYKYGFKVKRDCSKNNDIPKEKNTYCMQCMLC